jgi:site-specific recombinase XerC
LTAFIDRIAASPRTLTEAEQRQLLRVTGQRLDGLRDHMIYSLALATGLRQHELLALDVGDVLAEGSGLVPRRLALRVFKGASEESEPQEVMLPELVREKLRKFLDVRRRDGANLSSNAPLFLSRRRRRLSARQVRDGFAQWQERAGFERHFHFHALRHTACTNLYRRTKDIRLTQRFGRHKSMLTTSLYTHPSDDDLLRSIQGQIC